MVSVIIPARNEIYLEKTIRNVLENAEGEIEVIAVLDGYIPNPQIHTNDNRVTFLHFNESIGQRKSINEAAKIAKGKFVMKLDAHCAVDKGFDVKLAADCEYDWTVIPRMYNLDVKTWKPKLHKLTDYMYIGCEDNRLLRAEYYTGKEYRKLHKKQELIDDTMCCMGPCFFMHKDRFWELGGCDENHEGGWGQQGVEVSCKAWLSGGSLKVNKKTWFAHWFRGGGGPGFPYPISGKTVERVRKYSRDLWINNKWEKQTRDFKWMLDKFNPPGWNDKNDLTILFYSSNVISKKILNPVVRSLKKHGYPIISVTQEPMDLGKNIVVPKHRSVQNIYRQVLIAAKEAKTKYVALCEDDCLYVAEHFKNRPKNSGFTYNLNRWVLHLDEKIYSHRKRPVLSQCIADRDILIKNLEERFSLEKIYDKYCGEMGLYEKQLGMTEYKYETFETDNPNLIIAHDRNTLGRKYLGKDDSPSKNIKHWGDITYWLNKFGSSIKEGKILPNLWSRIGSVILDVDYLWDNRMKFCDPRKKDSLKLFIEVFPEYLDAVIKHGKLPRRKLVKFGYYKYLLGKLNPADYDKNTGSVTSKGKRHVFKLMWDVFNLYEDIKNNGLRNPLDFWKEPNGDLTLNRGGRRLEILHILGYKKVPCRIFKTKKDFMIFNPEKSIVENDSIHCLGMKQFQKYSEKSTDKYWVHNYLRLYDKHIGYMRQSAKKILEIGVFRGASLMLWKEAFPNAKIFGLDCKKRDDLIIDEKDYTIFWGKQEDEKFLKDNVAVNGQYDIIIDDAGHKPLEQQASLLNLWDSLSPGGWYIIEDLYGNYRKDRIKNSCIPQLKDLVDVVMLKDSIKSIHFYYNICFIQKN